MPHFKVSKQLLTFHRDCTHSKTFKIYWDVCHNFGVEMSHNLPSYFTITPPNNHINKPCEITVTCTPYGFPSHPVPLWIQFTDQLAPISVHNPIVIDIQFADDRHRISSWANNVTSYEQPQHIFQNPPFASIKAHQKVPAVLDCKVCLQLYSEENSDCIPRILTACGHTLCQKCAKTIQNLSMDRRSIACPFDRKVTEGEAEKLMKNFSITDLIRERNVVPVKPLPRISWKEPDVPCFEHSRHEATRYCEMCQVDFCDECFMSVHSSRILRLHKSILVSEKPFKFPECPIHQQAAKMLCTDIDCTAQSRLCCETCLEDTHKSHKAKEILEQVDENEGRMNRIVQTLTRAEEDITEIIKGASTCLKTINNTSAEYNHIFDLITEFYDNKRQAALDKLHVLMDSEKENMEMEKEQIEHDLRLIKETKMEIEKSLKKKTTLFVEDIIEKGDAMCSLDVTKGVNFTPFTMPTLRDLIHEEEFRSGSSQRSESFKSTKSTSWTSLVVIPPNGITPAQSLPQPPSVPLPTPPPRYNSLW